MIIFFTKALSLFCFLLLLFVIHFSFFVPHARFKAHFCLSYLLSIFLFALFLIIIYVLDVISIAYSFCTLFPHILVIRFVFLIILVLLYFFFFFFFHLILHLIFLIRRHSLFLVLFLFIYNYILIGGQKINLVCVASIKEDFADV